MCRIFFLCLAASGVFLAGCATGPVPTTERRPVSADRVYLPALLHPSGDRTTSFVLVRDRGSARGLAGVYVFIDGQKVARLAAAETVTVFATPGKHTLAARFIYGPIGPVERVFEADPKSRSPCGFTRRAIVPASGSVYLAVALWRMARW